MNGQWPTLKGHWRCEVQKWRRTQHEEIWALHLFTIKTDVGLSVHTCNNSIADGWRDIWVLARAKWDEGVNLPALWFCLIAPSGGQHCCAHREDLLLADWHVPERDRNTHVMYIYGMSLYSTMDMMTSFLRAIFLENRGSCLWVFNKGKYQWLWGGFLRTPRQVW